MKRRNPLPKLILGCLVLLASAAAFALPDDVEQPIQISADSASINDNTGVTVYSGRVEIVQGSMKIRGDRVELYRDGSGEVSRILSFGQPARFEQQPKAEQPVTQASGLRMEYRIAAQEITISEQAKVEQAQDTFSGDRIVYNMSKAIVDAYSGQNDDQRVRMVIQPRKSATP